MSDNYDPLTTQTAAITFRRLDALQDSIAAFGKTSSGSPAAVLVATDGTLQTRRLHRLTDEVVLIGTDATATGRPVLVDTQGRVSFRPLSALPVSDFDGLRAYFLGPAAAQVQGKADADGSLYVIDATGRATLASILGQLDITQTTLRDALLAAIQATQPRSISNFPGDYPDALAGARLASILAQLDLTTTALRDAITGASPNAKTLYGLGADLVAALQATQPRSVTNFPADYPDATAQTRLASILGQLNLTTTALRDAITAAIGADQPRHLTNWPADFPNALAESRLGSLVTQLDRTLSEIFDVKTAQGAVTAAANTGGLTVTLDMGATGRTQVQRYISAGAGATVLVQVSRDGATWRTLETLTFPPTSASVAAVQGTGYRYIRVTSATVGVTLDFEISAAR